MTAAPKRRRAPRRMYIHLIEGRPAYFDDSMQMLVLAGGRWARSTPLSRLLRPSLAAIRREQRASLDYRIARRFATEAEAWRYSYLLVLVDVVRPERAP